MAAEHADEAVAAEEVPAAEAAEVVAENFVNDSAMMIAYERDLETKRGGDALFCDPLAAKMAGEKGQALSDAFGANCALFGLKEWPEFHKTWTAVRTKFIDDTISVHAGTGRFSQLVNLGAGFDTRAYRLDCYAAFTNGSFEVDMEVMNSKKTAIFASDWLGKPAPKTAVHNVDLDFLSQETSLSDALSKTAFDATQPAVFVAEGLIMYLGETGKLKFLKDVSAAAGPGSVFVLQFMEDVERSSPAALGVAEATKVLGEGGWEQLQFAKFGDEKLNFGRFPTERFPPSASFSFLTCVKPGL